MRKISIHCLGLALLLGGSIAVAQPPGVTLEMINTTLPLEGAPLAVAGSYKVTMEGAFNSAGLILFRPTDLAAFPAKDNLPVLLWGNGGCAIEGKGYSDFLSTIASHGFLVLTTTAIAGEKVRQENAADLLGALEWLSAENGRSGSPLAGKIDKSHIAVMGQSCGGFLSISLGGDPRVGTIGVFNSGVQPASANAGAAPASPFPTTEALAKLHGPLMFINGGERDFMMTTSHANYALVNNLPVFYGSRHGAGHTATVHHPGGGEFANVAANWLKYQFKGDKKAGKMFVGKDCDLCTNANWDTESKGLDK